MILMTVTFKLVLKRCTKRRELTCNFKSRFNTAGITKMPADSYVPTAQNTKRKLTPIDTESHVSKLCLW